MYDHAGHTGLHTRRERFAYAIRYMAGTVIAGAITTCGAGMFMFLCVQIFLNKMATMLSSTVGFSLLYSLFWFMPLLRLIGPEGTFGTITLPWLKEESTVEHHHDFDKADHSTRDLDSGVSYVTEYSL
jgi:hypothetical protein